MGTGIHAYKGRHETWDTFFSPSDFGVLRGSARLFYFLGFGQAGCLHQTHIFHSKPELTSLTPPFCPACVCIISRSVRNGYSSWSFTRDFWDHGRPYSIETRLEYNQDTG
jgi:hypothetical protein